MNRSSLVVLPLLSLSLAPALGAQAPTFVTGELPCLPIGDHAVATARVDPVPAEPAEVRLYFRRLSHEVEDLYWIEMTPAEPGNFWAVLPLPESAKLEPKQLVGGATAERRAAWWRAKEASADRDPNRDLDAETIRERASVGKLEKRDWLGTRADAELEEWLARQRYEPSEWFVATVDGEGRVTARSEMRVAEVRDDCKVALTHDQRDAANELRIGDTAEWQEGDLPFHWECEHIATRVAIDGDESDPVCPVAIVWWPTAAGLGALGAIVITEEDPRAPEVSPSRP